MIFFFQAEDGIRDTSVTGVQTCALPIWIGGEVELSPACSSTSPPIPAFRSSRCKIGRASCRERVWILEQDVCLKKKHPRELVQAHGVNELSHMSFHDADTHVHSSM